MNETLKDQAQQIWQSQPVEGTKVSIEAIRLRAGKFERKVSRRNLRESIAAVIVIVWFGYFIATMHDILFRITWALFIAGMTWVIVQLYRKGTPKAVPADLGSATCLEFFRSELERQRDLVKDVWTWYLAPLVPGYVALNVADALASRGAAAWGRLAILDLFFAVIFVAIWQLNVRAARCLQRSIDSLPKLEDPQPHNEI